VITTALTAVVDAGPAEVWRAITDPAQVIRWDASALALLEPGEDWPQVGRHLVWRYQLGAVSLRLRDSVLEVVLEKRLRSQVSLGSFRFEQIWSLADDADRTRLGLSIGSASAMPTMGAELDRFDVRRRAAEYVDGKLRGLRGWLSSRQM
jgi:hypothetical protein